MALFAYLEDPGHPLVTTSIPTVKDGEKEDIWVLHLCALLHQYYTANNVCTHIFDAIFLTEYI